MVQLVIIYGLHRLYYQGKYFVNYFNNDFNFNFYFYYYNKDIY